MKPSFLGGTRTVKERGLKRKPYKPRGFFNGEQIDPASAKRMSAVFETNFRNAEMKDAERVAEALVSSANVPYERAYRFAQRQLTLQALKRVHEQQANKTGKIR